MTNEERPNINDLFNEYYVKPMRLQFGLMAQRRQTLRLTDPGKAEILDAMIPVDDEWTRWL
jgi:hypothetical protein